MHNRIIKILVFLLFFILLIVADFFQLEIGQSRWEETIDASRWGQYGDFIGGVVGTIIAAFSIYYLYKAYQEQLRANRGLHLQNEFLEEQEENRHYIEQVMQFDRLFHTLLSMYQRAVERYSVKGCEVGKASLAKMVAEYIKTSDFSNNDHYPKKVKAATKGFEPFIAQHRSIIYAHMRLVYQLFDLLYTFKIKEEDKKVYAKILRSQFVDEELILMRYNAHTTLGEKMREHLFRYNVFKHLPLMGLLEFKCNTTFLQDSEINLLNTFFITWRRNIFKMFDEGETRLEEKLGKRYIIVITLSPDNKEYSYTFNKLNPTGGRNYEPLVPILNKFTIGELSKLLRNFHDELFKMSNFETYNTLKENFRVNKKITGLDGQTIVIKITSDEKIVIKETQELLQQLQANVAN